MINLYNSIPKVYYDESRDFQVFAKSFEILFNYLKTNVDLVNVDATVKNSDSRLLQLLLKTLGFDKKHEYDDNDIRAVSQVFNYILKYKGSKKAIEYAIKVLLNTQHIISKFEVREDKNDRFNWILWLPSELQRVEDVVLLEDLFDYILPAGYTYSITYVKYSTNNPSSTYDVDSNVSKYAYAQEKLGRIAFNDDKKIVDMTEQEREESLSKGLGTYYTGNVAKVAQKVYSSDYIELNNMGYGQGSLTVDDDTYEFNFMANMGAGWDEVNFARTSGHNCIAYLETTEEPFETSHFTFYGLTYPKNLLELVKEIRIYDLGEKGYGEVMSSEDYSEDTISKILPLVASFELIGNKLYSYKLVE